MLTREHKFKYLERMFFSQLSTDSTSAELSIFFLFLSFSLWHCFIPIDHSTPLLCYFHFFSLYLFCTSPPSLPSTLFTFISHFLTDYFNVIFTSSCNILITTMDKFREYEHMNNIYSDLVINKRQIHYM